MGEYWIFQVEINPLKFTQGILWISTIPTSTAMKIYLCRESVIVSKVKSPHEAEICTLILEKEHKCIWQVIILEQSQLQSFKTVLTQHRMTTGTYMTHHHKPQFYGYYSQWRGVQFKISAMKVSQQNLWAVSTEDLSLLVFILKLRWYLRESLQSWVF